MARANRITYVYRHSHPDAFSLERVFDTIRAALPVELEQERVELPAYSDTWVHRWQNISAVRRLRTDVVHVIGDAQYAVLGARGCRSVLTVHDCNTLLRSGGIRRAAAKLVYYVAPLRSADAITTVSTFTKQQLVELVGADASKIRVIHNPVRTDLRFAPRSANSSVPTVLHMGTGWNKNFERVVEALRDIPCRLIVAGTVHPPQQRLLDASKIHVVLARRLSDAELIEAYEACTIVSFPSLYEGFGLPIIEANAVGRAVIAGDNTSMPEVARDAAVLVRADSVEAIREAFLSVLMDPGRQEALIEAGRENVKRFAPGVIAGQYQQLYRDLERR